MLLSPSATPRHAGCGNDLRQSGPGSLVRSRAAERYAKSSKSWKALASPLCGNASGTIYNTTGSWPLEVVSWALCYERVMQRSSFMGDATVNIYFACEFGGIESEEKPHQNPAIQLKRSTIQVQHIITAHEVK